MNRYKINCRDRINRIWYILKKYIYRWGWGTVRDKELKTTKTKNFLSYFDDCLSRKEIRKEDD